MIPVKLCVDLINERFAKGATCYYICPTDETLESLHRRLAQAARRRGKRWKFFKHGDAIGIKPKGIK